MSNVALDNWSPKITGRLRSFTPNDVEIYSDTIIVGEQKHETAEQLRFKSDKARDVYNELLQEVTENSTISSKRHARTIEVALIDLISIRLKQPALSFDELSLIVLNKLKYLAGGVAQNTVFIPVRNLHIKANAKLQLGNVLFEAITPQLLGQLEHGMIRAIRESQQSLSESEIVEFQNKINSGYFVNATLAHVTYEAEGALAIELAYKEVEEAVDILAALVFSMIPAYERIEIEIGVPFITPHLVVASYERQEFGLHGTVLKQSLDEPLYCLIDDRRWERLKNQGIAELSIVASKRKTSLGLARIYRVARWLGRSVRMPDTAERFLMAVNALEAAFTLSGSPVSSTLADGAALLP